MNTQTLNIAIPHGATNAAVLGILSTMRTEFNAFANIHLSGATNYRRCKVKTLYNELITSEPNEYFG